MTSLTLLVLKTAQVAELCRFYHALGIDFVKERHGKGPVHYSGRAGDVLLEIYPLPSGVSVADATTRLGFKVDSIDNVINSLELLGAKIVTPATQTEWGRRAVVRDPDGRAVELSES
jgi:predicted enzyme related to lactoylglutathione lyase